MARQRLKNRVAGSLARRIWPYIEPHARYSVFGPHVKVAGPSHLVDATQPTYALPRIVETVPGEGTPVKVGRYTSMHDHSVVFLGGLHDVSLVSTFHFHWIAGLPGPREQPLGHGPVVIGSDVWIAYEAIIMSGVTIGHGAVVAARAVVTRDVAPYEIVGGIPARHISWRFDQPTREALLRIRWWDWPYEKVLERLDEIQSSDVSGFIRRHDPGPESADQE